MTGKVRCVLDEIVSSLAAIMEAANRGLRQLGHGLAGDDPDVTAAFLPALLNAHAFLSGKCVCVPAAQLTTNAEKTGSHDGTYHSYHSGQNYFFSKVT